MKQELTPETKAQLKEAFPGKPLYSKELFGQTYVFTTITREQYKKILDWGTKNPGVKRSDYDDKFVEYGLIWPQLPPQEEAGLAAGVFPTLSLLIQEKSGLAPADGDIEKLYQAESIHDKKDMEEPKPEDIKKLKSLSTLPLHGLKIMGEYFVIRPIVRLEWNQVHSLPENSDTDVEICKRCATWPTDIDWSNLEAGIATCVCRHILNLSGFTNEGECEEL